MNMALTSHTLAPVMVAVGGAGLKDSVKMRDDLPEAGIASITATFFNLCGYEAPSDYCPTLIKTDRAGVTQPGCRSLSEGFVLEEWNGRRTFVVVVCSVTACCSRVVVTPL